MPQVKETKEQKIIIPQLIVGLGNPEPKYDRTRHNIGFAAVDALAKAWGISLSENKKFQGEVGEGIGINGAKIRLLKPLTYMNLSGQSVLAVTHWHKIPAESVLIIYDEMDLPIGKTRLRLSGSAGGHNGMKSIISHLHTDKFPRLRIGIGKPKKDADGTISHVLGKFSPDEAALMTKVLDFVVDCTEIALKQGVEMAMNRCNSQVISLTEE